MTMSIKAATLSIHDLDMRSPLYWLRAGPFVRSTEAERIVA
jgi:hypothetical protein